MLSRQSSFAARVASLSLLRDCVHQERECLLESGGPHRAALEVSEAHNHELVRRNDQRGLAARTGHVIRLFRDRERTVPVDPKEAAVDGTLVGFPRWRQCAHKLRVPFGQNPLAVPDTILKIEVAKTRPIT